MDSRRRTGVRLGAVGLVVALSAGCCCPKKPRPPGGGGTGENPVRLETEPLDAIDVEDAVEAALLEQELGIKPIATVGQRLYFRTDDATRRRLADLGFTVRQEDANDVLQRVMRVSGGLEESALRDLGLRLLLRERDGWIVQGTIAKLHALTPLGFRVEDLRGREPHPRPIVVYLEGPEQVGEVARAGVDVYAAGYDKQRRYAVHGGAFDYAIDALKERGFAVEIDEDPAGGEP